MLSITRRDGEYFTIEPITNLDPTLTVADLFKDGPIRIHLMHRGDSRQMRVAIDAPEELVILRGELYIAGETI